MAWIQVHQNLKDHRKLFDAADELEIHPPHMMGLLISFWLWALDNAPDGSLRGIAPRTIARAAQWDGPAEKLSDALIRAGWLDKSSDGTLSIHDWYEYAGKLIDQRQAEKERSQRRRHEKTGAAASSKSSDPDRRSTAGRPEENRQKAVGRVEKSRVENKIDNIPPISPPGGQDAFASYAGENGKLLSALRDFEAMRKKIKKPMSDRSKEMLCKRLDELEPSDGGRIDLLNEAIFHCWQSVYPREGGKNGTNAAQRDQGDGGKVPQYGTVL